MIEDLVQAVADNFLALAYLVALLIIVCVIAWTIARWTDARNRIRMAELSIQNEKMGMIKRQAMLKELAEASSVLTSQERDRLDAIREDIGVLSRKNIALMNEIEAKTTRLERGTDLAKMQEQIQRIYKQEKKLFGLKEER
ncbi:TPA: hypothetical protein HA259_03395 [Thermoplasmata archaeon]|nr:hypothetical protein [Thermoplasmata archaeon]